MIDSSNQMVKGESVLLTARFYLDYKSHPLPFSLASHVFIRVYSEVHLKILLTVLTMRVKRVLQKTAKVLMLMTL